jgi:hypothetical protein
MFYASELVLQVFKNSAVVKFIKFHLTDKAFDFHFAPDKRGFGFFIEFHYWEGRGLGFGSAKISDKV